MSGIQGLILLYCVVTAVAIASRRFGVPYTVALVVTGLLLGALPGARLPHLTKELLFSLFLPGLLFEAAFHLRFRELRENARVIGLLAVPGVVLAILLTAALLVGATALLGGAVPHVSWPTALVFGGVIAATDPVAVTALFRQVAAPRRLHVLIESESLLNDGTSIVFLTLILAAVGGAAPTPAPLFLDFFRITLGGAAAGIAVGWGVTHVIARIDEPVIEITLTTIAAYGSFVLADTFHCSGVIATVVAAVVCGNYGRLHAMSPNSQHAVNGFGEWLAFTLNSAVFLLLGAEVRLGVLARAWPLVAIGTLAVLAARAAVVGATALLVHRSPERMPRSWGAVMTWGGLRGALSLVLALALPDTLADRRLIVVLTAGVVLVSLVGQGLTMGSLLRRMGISGAAS
jgi:CPA1 family monovalent cation:H+ antiporter